MIISKWTLNFTPNQDSSIVPVWVSFPSFPLPLFNKEYLCHIASLLGRPLRVDAATSDLKLPSVARVLVDLDVSKQPVHRIWIGEDISGFWQKIEYDSWPQYCQFCQKIGHLHSDCFVKNPSLRPIKVSSKQIYVAKEQNVVPISKGTVDQQRIVPPSPEVVQEHTHEDVGIHEGSPMVSNHGVSAAETVGQVIDGSIQELALVNNFRHGHNNDAAMLCQNDKQLQLSVGATHKDIDFPNLGSGQQVFGTSNQNTSNANDDMLLDGAIMDVVSDAGNPKAGKIIVSVDLIEQHHEVNKVHLAEESILQIQPVDPGRDGDSVNTKSEDDNHLHVPHQIPVDSIFSRLRDNLSINEQKEKEKDNTPMLDTREQKEKDKTPMLDTRVSDQIVRQLSPAELVLQKNWKLLRSAQAKGFENTISECLSDSGSEKLIEDSDNVEQQWLIEDKLSMPHLTKKGKKRRGRPKKNNKKVSDCY